MDPTDVLPQVAAIAPEIAGGYAEVRAVIDRDGELPAARKALLVAAGATARGMPELAQRELARGRGLGLADTDVGAVGAAFLLIRGEESCARFAAAAGGLPTAGAPRPADHRDAVAYFLDYMRVDTLPERMALMAERAPDVFSGYHRMHHGALVADPSQAVMSELAMITVNAAELATRFVAIHAVTARRAGATDGQLVEAVVCAFPAAGIAAWAAAAEAIFADAG